MHDPFDKADVSVFSMIDKIRIPDEQNEIIIVFLEEAKIALLYDLYLKYSVVKH